MSKHEFKFGDRVTVNKGTEHEAHGVVVDFDKDGHPYIHFAGWEGDSYYPKQITPGWPVPEGCVRVRAAVRVTNRGAAKVFGVEHMGGTNDSMLAELARFDHGCEAEAVHFIEADIPLPTPETYRAEVVS